METQNEIPDSATRFILFQRTSHLTLANTRLIRFLHKRIPSFPYKPMVLAEAKLRGKKIKEMYLADMEQEYQSIKGYLPEICAKILDIGCGVAGIDLFLHQHYLNRDVDFFLLDKSRVEDNVFYDFNPKGAFYNSLPVARELLVKNGVAQNRVHLLEATEDYSLDIEKGIDLVLSLLSWGFHYPVSLYLDGVYDLLREKGILILDIRKNTDGLDLLTQKFGGYRVILEASKHIRVCMTK